MILLIIKSYLIPLLMVGAGALSIFLVGLYFILRPKSVNNKPQSKQLLADGTTSEKMISTRDFSAIAGDDMLATQLDLARAYIETGKLSLAKKILDSVAQQGSDNQRKEVLSLLAILNTHTSS